MGGQVDLEATIETCVDVPTLRGNVDAVTAIELALADGAAEGMADFSGVYHGLAPTMRLRGGTEASMDSRGLSAWATSVHTRPQAIGCVQCTAAVGGCFDVCLPPHVRVCTHRYTLRDIRDAVSVAAVKANLGQYVIHNQPAVRAWCAHLWLVCVCVARAGGFAQLHSDRSHVARALQAYYDEAAAPAATSGSTVGGRTDVTVAPDGDGVGCTEAKNAAASGRQLSSVIASVLVVAVVLVLELELWA